MPLPRPYPDAMPLTRSARLLLPLVAGALAVGLAAGCSSPAPTAAPDAVPSSGATPPVQPSLGLIDPAAHAPVAAVRGYYEALSAATNTGVVSGVRQLATPECLCQKVVDVLETYFRAGRMFRGYDFRVTGVQAAQVRGDDAAVRISYTVSAYTSLQGNDVLGQEKARSGTAVIGLVRQDDRWLLSTVSNQSGTGPSPA